MYGASIDLRTKLSADPISNLKRNLNAQSLSSSPDANGADSPATDVVSILDRTIERVSSPINISFSEPQTGDTGQRRDVLAKSLTRRPPSGLSTQSGSRRNAFAAPTDPTRSSLYSFSDFSDQGQLGYLGIVPNSAVDGDGSTI